MNIQSYFLSASGRSSKNVLLLVAILAFLLAQPIFFMINFSMHVAHGLLCLLLLAATVSTGNRQLARYLGWGLILPAVIFTWNVHTSSPGWLISVSYGLNVAVFFVAIVNLLNDIYRERNVNIPAIIGAVNVYLLIGLAFALIYDWVSLLNHQAIRGLHDQGVYDAHLSHSVYFSFVTLTTLGYGDIAPITPVARTVAWVEAVLGQLILATLIAGLVGKLVASSVSERKES